ncbi:DUF1724 domain-containing protein [Methanobrevibacter sp. TMH8]|uniref:helix-turn-helix transcriptional regulator n=1 Tax=Methanobrevibacter sp. TMH8 TaxID=2848611 RepID=UPI001CCAE845|nr:transcriptional regulator FilR1 domain-containing protein [Methanobrevibacter sp. TMH8]MBZ9571683.1 DUF1724 domain-containing protein [Methanobrevibacter sp. TMH8]
MFNEKICYLDLYEEVMEEIKFLTNSEIRMNVLKYLSNLSANIKDLSLATNLKYSAVSHSIHRLMEYGYLYDDDGKFGLNNIALMKFMNFMNFRDSFCILRDYMDFWDDHDISCISVEDLSDLSSLKRSYLVESIRTDIYQPQNIFKEVLMNSNTVRSIFPFINSDYPIIFENLLKNSVNIELLCEKSVTQNFIQSIDTETLKKGLKNGNFKIKSLKKNINLFLTITDDFMFFGLCKDSGKFDQNRLLVSNESKAIDWANKIFEKCNYGGNKLYF